MVINRKFDKIRLMYTPLFVLLCFDILTPKQSCVCLCNENRVVSRCVLVPIPTDFASSKTNFAVSKIAFGVHV